MSSSSSSVVHDDVDHVAQLTAMGFSDANAREALRMTSGNLELAVNQLLSGFENSGGGGTGGASSGANNSPSQITPTSDGADTTSVVVQGSTNQYTFPDVGRSACTCIALTAASNFLSNNNEDTNISKDRTVRPEFLDQMITQGIALYQKVTTSATTTVEHLSAEKILQQQQDMAIQVAVGGIRQGVLTNNRDHPLGLKALLEGIQSESRGNNNEWASVLMTKTPESVLVCLPTSQSSPSSFWLIDSHPRPMLGMANAYAFPHPTLQSLLETLYTIFPTTDLGPDIPEMMAELYNSFDLYPLMLKNQKHDAP